MGLNSCVKFILLSLWIFWLTWSNMWSTLRRSTPRRSRIISQPIRSLSIRHPYPHLCRTCCSRWWDMFGLFRFQKRFHQFLLIKKRSNYLQTSFEAFTSYFSDVVYSIWLDVEEGFLFTWRYTDHLSNFHFIWFISSRGSFILSLIGIVLTDFQKLNFSSFTTSLRYSTIHWVWGGLNFVVSIQRSFYIIF